MVIKVNINDVSELLNKVGESTTIENTSLKQLTGPYENYYKLEGNGGKWLYGLYVVEKQNNPYFDVIKEFDTEEEGAKYYFLDRLSSQYFLTKVQPFMLAHGELDINGPKFNESKLYQAMTMLKIPKYYFVTDPSQIVKGHRCIMLTKKEQEKWSVSFIAPSGKVINQSLPIDHQWALFIAFRKVYRLYIYETEVKNLLESNNVNIDFTEKEINKFC